MPIADPKAEADPMTAVRADALAEHYQRTVDLVARAWERRNRQFIVLIAVLAAAVLVAFSRQLIAPLLEALIVGQLPGLQQNPAGERLSTFLPLASDLLLALLVVAIFYLMASLCHASGMIINLYVYLGMMEREVRHELQLPKDQIAFTREGPFYEATGRHLSRPIGACYKIVLGTLLVAFFALRIYFDLTGTAVPGRESASAAYGWLVGNFLLIVDVAVAIPTMWLFLRYARLSPMGEIEVRRRMMPKQV
jgi:hypothetical protein